MITILMVSAKLATLGLFKVKIFCNKGYYVIIFVYDVTNKILSRDSNYIVDVAIWSKFGNSSFSMREFIITQFQKDLTRKTNFFEGCCWFKFNNLGLALGMALKFYTSVAKGLILRANYYVCISYSKKTNSGRRGGGLLASPHPE